MHLYSIIIYGALSLILNQLAIGQANLQGTFTRTDNMREKTIDEVLIIKSDSIWFSRIKVGKNIPAGEKFENWAGTLKYYKNGYNNGPFYSCNLFVMSCDTCPQFWKYTRKRKDSLDVKTYVWVMGKTDTIIKNGDTSYSTPAIASVDDPADLNRMREIIFTTTNDGNILMNKNVYRKKSKH